MERKFETSHLRIERDLDFSLFIDLFHVFHLQEAVIQVSNKLLYCTRYWWDTQPEFFIFCHCTITVTL